MTYRGPHERTVVQGTDYCTCGNDWPCPKSAEGRWKALRDWLDNYAAEMNQHADTIAADEWAAAGRASNARALAEVAEHVREHMDDLEGR